MSLDLSSLEKGVLSLEAALRVAASAKAAMFTDEEKKVITAGVIQNFEFTYELCWKFLRRWIEVNIGRTQSEGIPQLKQRNA